MKVKAGILVMNGLRRDASKDKKMGKGVGGESTTTQGIWKLHKKACSSSSSKNNNKIWLEMRYLVWLD